MSYKTIMWLIHSFRELAAALEQNNARLTAKWIKEIDEENNQELNFGREHNINFLVDLHEGLKTGLQFIKNNQKKRKESLAAIKDILGRLEKVTDQTKVRDQLIEEIISPILTKKWGWKKKGRSFVSKERTYFKKLRIYSSQWNDYYHIEFTFEMDVSGKGIEMYGERISYNTPLGKRDQWYRLTQDADLQKIKAQIQADLQGPVKYFFSKYN